MRQAKKFCEFPIYTPYDMAADEILRSYHWPLTDSGKPMPKCKYEEYPEPVVRWLDTILGRPNRGPFKDYSLTPLSWTEACISMLKDSYAGIFQGGSKKIAHATVLEQCERLDSLEKKFLVTHHTLFKWVKHHPEDSDLLTAFMNYIVLSSRHEVGRRLRKIMSQAYLPGVGQRRFSAVLRPNFRDSGFTYSVSPNELDAIVYGKNGLVERGFKYSYMGDYTNYGEITHYDTWRLSADYLSTKLQPPYNLQLMDVVENNFLSPRLIVPNFNLMLNKRIRKKLIHKYPSLDPDDDEDIIDEAYILERPPEFYEHDNITGQDLHNITGHIANLACQATTARLANIPWKDYWVFVNLDDNAAFFKNTEDRARYASIFPSVVADYGMDVNPDKAYYGTKSFLVSQVVHKMYFPREGSDEKPQWLRTLTLARGIGKTLFSERVIGLSTTRQYLCYRVLALISRFRNLNPIQGAVYLYIINQHQGFLSPKAMLSTLSAEEYTELLDVLQNSFDGATLIYAFEHLDEMQNMQIRNSLLGMSWLRSKKLLDSGPLSKLQTDSSGQYLINDNNIADLDNFVHTKGLEPFEPVVKVIQNGYLRKRPKSVFNGPSEMARTWVEWNENKL